MTTRRNGRFDAFVWVSAALHCLAVLVVLALSITAKREKPKVVSFELMGPAPKGDGGGEMRSAPVAPDPAPAPAPAPEPAPPKPSPAPPAPVKPAPVKVPAKPTPAPTPAKTPGPTTSTAKPNTSTTPAVATSGSGQGQAAPPGLHPGTPGKPDGDTLSLGSGQGLPSPMALWLSRVKFQVERNWRAPEGLSGVQVPPEVVFQVARDGRADRVQLKTRSGNPTLDRLALRAVQAVDNFPPIPEVWPEDKVVVRYVLQYAPR